MKGKLGFLAIPYPELTLDIIFIRDGRVQSISENIPQCDERCPLIQSQQPVNYVMEVSGGTSQSLGLSSEDDIKIIYLEVKDRTYALTSE